MNKENNKNHTPSLDEEFVMKIMAEGARKQRMPSALEPPDIPDVKPENIEPVKQSPSNREKVRTKKNSEPETYGEHFLKTHKMAKRGEKSIYIRAEHHERLSRIVQVIGEDQIPLYAYLDNILDHHFKLFEQEITDDFNNKYKPIF